jgi:hypothetical protein
MKGFLKNLLLSCFEQQNLNCDIKKLHYRQFSEDVINLYLATERNRPEISRIYGETFINIFSKLIPEKNLPLPEVLVCSTITSIRLAIVETSNPHYTPDCSNYFVKLENFINVSKGLVEGDLIIFSNNFIDNVTRLRYAVKDPTAFLTTLTIMCAANIFGESLEKFKQAMPKNIDFGESPSAFKIVEGLGFTLDNPNILYSSWGMIEACVEINDIVKHIKTNEEFLNYAPNFDYIIDLDIEN